MANINVTGRVNVRLHVKNVEYLQRLLRRMADQAQNPPVGEIAEYVANATRYRLWRDKKDPRGNAWEALSQITVEDRVARGFSGTNILVRTRDLVDSVRVEKVTRTGFTVVADPVDERGRSYANYHQRGTSKMPARPFMGLSDANWQEIRRRIAAHLRREAGAAGGGSR